MKKLKIFVCCHKKEFYLSNDFYIPIQVGAACSKLDLGITRDDSGLNISGKNANYCELTAQYWIWKNVKDVEYVGLCHYRRYFDLNHNSSFLSGKFISSEEMVKNSNINLDLLETADAIVTDKVVEILTLKDAYCWGHIMEDYDILKEVVKEKYPEYINDFNHVMEDNNKYSFANMIIAKKQVFDEYSEWLFTILFEVEKKVKVSEYPYQKRIFGFMSERLLNVYMYHHKELKVIQRPVYSLMNQKNLSYVRRMCNNAVRNFAFMLNNYIMNK